MEILHRFYRDFASHAIFLSRDVEYEVLETRVERTDWGTDEVRVEIRYLVREK